MTDGQPIPTEILYRNLKGSIERLTLAADQQIAYLDSILGHLTTESDASGYGNDELAIELAENVYLLPNILDDGLLTEEAVEAIKSLDDFLEENSGQKNADFWRRDALYLDEHWNEVRRLAKVALSFFQQ